jgi:hypothetical protein
VAHLETTPTLGATADAAFAVMWDHLVLVDPLGPSDAIFCFGSRSASVPTVAASRYAEGLAPTVVVTGGGPTAHERPEADVYADALVDRGVPAGAIVIERLARHTGENVALGLEALRGVCDPRRLVAVSWALGMRRAIATFARQRPDLEVLASPALPDDRPRWDASPENVADALGEWDRLEVYAERGFISPQPRPAEVVDAARVLRSELSSAAALGRPQRGAPPARTGR